MIKFANPQYLAWIPFVLAGGLVVWIYDGMMFKRFQMAFGKKLGPYLTASASLGKRRLRLFCQVMALCCFLVALARPQLGSRQDEIKQIGLEMVFALDVSNSMLAEDDKPSRLEHAKHELSRILDKLNGDKVGVVAFAGSAALVAPLTSDYSALKMFIEALTTDSVSTQGTNFRSVVELSMKAFERGGIDEDEKTVATRVILFASDGEDNNDKNLNAVIQKAVESGIRIFGLGFGTAHGGPIPIRDERGNLKDYKKTRSGEVVNSIPDEEFLSKVAKWGQGSYYHATFEETELNQVVQDLAKLQKAEFNSRVSTTYDEKFQIPLLLGLLLAALDLVVGYRKRAPEFWKGRFEVAR